MTKLIWIDDSQYLCFCAEPYQQDLGMEVGDILFVRDELKPRSYQRLGAIKALSGRKVVVSMMNNLGVGAKGKLESSHYDNIGLHFNVK
jgi:hypothetical protein